MAWTARPLARLISEAALDNKVHALGLAMSESAVARGISDDPAFKNAGGQFDPLRFQEILRDNGYNERSFVRQQRSVYLRQEIAEAVAGKITTPRALLAAIHRFRNETRSIDYFLLTPTAAGDIPPPNDAAVQAYFDAHRVTFAAPETRKIVTLSRDSGASRPRGGRVRCGCDQAVRRGQGRAFHDAGTTNGAADYLSKRRRRQGSVRKDRGWRNLRCDRSGSAS